MRDKEQAKMRMRKRNPNNIVSTLDMQIGMPTYNNACIKMRSVYLHAYLNN